ncbi:MAG: hypothetical protein U0X73_06775 [Thermoanaerobaculia bacterium]
MTFEYAVVIRRNRRGEPSIWQLWFAGGCAREDANFLAVMDAAGALGFEAFAAGNFDEASVPEVLLKRAVAPPPPPPAAAKSAPARRAKKP